MIAKLITPSVGKKLFGNDFIPRQLEVNEVAQKVNELIEHLFPSNETEAEPELVLAPEVVEPETQMNPEPAPFKNPEGFDVSDEGEQAPESEGNAPTAEELNEAGVPTPDSEESLVNKDAENEEDANAKPADAADQPAPEVKKP